MLIRMHFVVFHSEVSSPVKCYLRQIISLGDGVINRSLLFTKFDFVNYVENCSTYWMLIQKKFIEI